MILTKEQINEIKEIYARLNKAHNEAEHHRGHLASFISDSIGIEGNIDFLQGDGFGFMPDQNDVEDSYDRIYHSKGYNAHISIEDILDMATNKTDINYETISSKLSF